MQESRKEILLLNRSFWPDVEATGQFLTELCEQLVKKYRVTAVAGRSYYAKEEVFKTGRFHTKEIHNGIEIIRVRHTKFWKASLTGRIANWVTYGVLSFFVSLRLKPRIIIACTDPPFLGIMAMVLGRIKSAPFVYNLGDLFPDVAVELGKISENNLLGRVFDYLNILAFKSASSIICLGPSMEKRIRVKGLWKKEGIKIIPYCVDTSKIRPILKKDNPLLDEFGLRDKFIIMHSGNIGLSQDFSSILEAIARVQNEASFFLVFAGEGAGKEALKEKIKLLNIKNVLFIPYQVSDMFVFSLSMADLHLITLKKGLAGAIVPSKVYGIMAAGRPYLAVTDREAEPACFTREFKCGLWAPPDDVESIIRNIKWVLANPAELEAMGLRGRAAVEKKFGKGLIINEWMNTLEKLGNI